MVYCGWERGAPPRTNRCWILSIDPETGRALSNKEIPLSAGMGGPAWAAWSPAGNEIALELRDDGPGVSPEHRADIFKPYFTTNEKGTGLGLAVVQQIVLAHGWEVECLPTQPRGAVFRISHLRLAAATSAATRSL